MNKNELVRAVADSADLSLKDAEAAVSAVTEIITATLREGDRVQLVGFGTFEVKHRAAHIGRNPQTQKEMEIPAATIPVFKPGKLLKDAVDQGE